MSTAFDSTPLYRSMIGVDRMGDPAEGTLQAGTSAAYPPCDIEKTGEDSYRIALAVAGFAPADLAMTAEPNLLLVKGRKSETDGRNALTFIHQGLPQRAFERRLELGDYVIVKDAAYAHGVLSIALACEAPEALKPRQIAIGACKRDRAPAVQSAQARKAA